MTSVPEPGTASFKTPHYEISLRRDYILEITLFNQVYTPELVSELIRHVKNVTGNKEYLVLTHASPQTRMPIQSMRLLRQPDSLEFVLAKAYVIKSPQQRMRAWLYRIIFRPDKPVEFFKTPEAAEKWLKNLIDLDVLN